METQDKENIKRKAFAISTLMGNDKLSQAIWDSFSAPVGSTKNAKAKSILYSMKKANQIHDGKGGNGGNWWQQPQFAPSDQGMSSAYDESGQFKDSKFRGTEDVLAAQREASKLPPRTIPSSKGRGIIRGVDDLISWSTDPASRKGGKTRLDVGVEEIGKAGVRVGTGAGEALKFMETDVIYPWTNLGSTFMQNIYSWPGRAGEYLTDPEWSKFEKGRSLSLDPYRKGIAGKKFPLDSKISSAYRPSAPQKDYYKVVGKDEVYDSKTHKHITDKEAAQIPNFWDNVSEVLVKPTDFSKWVKKDDRMVSSAAQGFTSQEDSDKRYKDLLMTGIDPTAATYEAKWASGFDPNKEAVGKELEKNPYYNTNFGINTFMENPEDAENIYNNMDDSEKDFWRDSYEASIIGLAESAHELGLGSKTFAWTLLQDKKKLAAALGIPESEANALPEGLLSEQLIDLRNTIDTKYKVENQLDELLKLQKRDLDINDKFITYIHNKDEYLNEVSELLRGAEKRIVSMDTSNPYVAKRMGMYVNYLTVLQGRQNQRYIDFLDTGIQAHKNELDSVSLTLNRSIEQANQEYKDMGSVTIESYNMMKTMLEDIYDNIESREDRQFKLEEQKQWRIDAKLKSANLVLQNAKINAELFGGGGIEVNASTAKMFTNMYSAGENDDGTLNFTTYNPYDVMNQASTAGQNSEYAMNSFMKDMGYTISKSVGTGSLDQFEKFRDSMIKNISSNIVDLNNMSKAEQEAYNKLSPEEQTTFNEIQNSLITDQNQMYSKLQTNLQAGLEEYFGATEEKIRELRKAIDDLNYGRGWFGLKETFGIMKKPKREDFVKDHSNLQGEFAGALYDYTAQTVEAGELSGPRDVWGDLPDDLLPKIVSEKLTPYLML